MTLHIHVAVGLEGDTLRLQKGALAAPAWGGAAFIVYDAVAGEQLGTWRITQGTTHHPRMAGPSSQGGDMAVGGDPATGNLADDVEHVVTKRPSLLRRHPVGIVLHLQDISALNDRPVDNLPEGGEVVGTTVLVVQVVGVLPDVEGQ